MQSTEVSTRRQMIAGFSSLVALAAAGCSGPSRGEEIDREGTPAARTSARSGAQAMTMHRDPGCGCCEQWAQRARAAGYRVTVSDSQDMPAIKRRLGVPDRLASCHTVEVGGYVLEGHVPLEHVARLLAKRPAGLRGIAVPGMPRGSPGMEMPDGSADAFEVLAFARDGRISIFRA